MVDRSATRLPDWREPDYVEQYTASAKRLATPQSRAEAHRNAAQNPSMRSSLWQRSAPSLPAPPSTRRTVGSTPAVRHQLVSSAAPAGCTSPRSPSLLGDGSCVHVPARARARPAPHVTTSMPQPTVPACTPCVRRTAHSRHPAHHPLNPAQHRRRERSGQQPAGPNRRASARRRGDPQLDATPALPPVCESTSAQC